MLKYIKKIMFENRYGITLAADLYELKKAVTSRSYHKRSLNSNDGWNVTGCMSFMNMPILCYSDEIRSANLYDQMDVISATIG